MKSSIPLLLAVSLLCAGPVAAQSGTVTYDVDVGNIQSYTVDYGNRTIRETYEDGTFFTRTDGSMDFDAFSRYLQQTYGDPRNPPCCIDPL